MSVTDHWPVQKGKMNRNRENCETAVYSYGAGGEPERMNMHLVILGTFHNLIPSQGRSLSNIKHLCLNNAQQTAKYVHAEMWKLSFQLAKYKGTAAAAAAAADIPIKEEERNHLGEGIVPMI
ncbi:hypothetical protein DVH24_033876 [Malus domestica]|uniref:Uncharacterized protein n=1 Tax=Malus domestica TaxID=3750 RepID=A0A498KM88_MALDO|nr:hypothetical protein DVH24_033876 [Malus domestica]